VIPTPMPLEAASYGDQDRAFFRRAAVANAGLGALMRFTGGAVLQLIALQVFLMDLKAFVALTAVLGFVNLLQLAGLALYYRHGPFRTLIACYRARTWALVLLALTPFLLPVSQVAAVTAWCLLIVAVNAVHCMGFAVSWPPIVRAGTTQAARGRITSRLRAIQTCIATALVVAIAMLGPEHFGTGAFVGFTLAFAAFSFVSTRQVAWMRDNVHCDPPRTGSFAAQLQRDLRFLAGDRKARRFLFVVVAFGFVGLPLQVFYLDGLLGLPRNLIFWFLAAATLVAIGSMLLWGRAVDERGGLYTARASLALVLAGVAVQACYLGLAPRELPWRDALVLGSLLTVNIGVQGLALVWFNEALKLLPAHATTAGVMIYGSAYEISSSAAAFTAGMTWLHGDGPTAFLAFLAIVAAVTAATLAAAARLQVFTVAGAASRPARSPASS
jgi:hypothetical protein